MIQPGDVVGDYRVIERAGSGGMGVVFKAEHLITKRIEAMKVLPLGIARGPDEIRRFEREIQAQARLQHPHIASLYSAVRRDDAFALLMEWVEGETLERHLVRGPLPLDTATALAAQVLEGLAYAHRNGVVHCDVSPANIFVTRDGSVKLTDFGLARAAADLGMADGVAIGSPWHMAPEQVRATGPIDARADLYAAGTVLYEMLAGRKLFDVEGAFAILRAHLDTMPEAPGAHRSGIPPALDAVVMKALAKDPAARFQSADEFRLAIQGAMLGRAPARRRAALRPMLVAAWMGMIACAAVLLPMRPGIPVVEAPAPAAPPATPAPLPAPVAAPEPEPPAPAVEPAPARRQIARRAAPPRAVQGPVRPAPRVVVLTPAPVPADPDPDDPMPESVASVISSPAAAQFEAPSPPAPAAEAKPPKTGNRFVRAIGKLNPFRKRQ